MGGLDLVLDRELLGLSLRVCFSPAEDLSLIIAEPRLADMEGMIPEKYILDIKVICF